MHDSSLVGRLESLRDLSAGRDGLVDRQRPARQPRSEILAGHELEGQEAQSVGLVVAVDLGDIGMVEGGQGLGLAREASAQGFALGHG